MQILEKNIHTLLQQYSPTGIGSQDADAALNTLTDFLDVLHDIQQSDGGQNENQ